MERIPGVVQRIDGKRAWIAVDAAAAGCGACAKRSACAIGEGGRPGGKRDLLVDAVPGLRTGAPVTVAVDPNDILPAAALGYLAPAFLLVAGAVAGEHLAPLAALGDGQAVLGALTGLAIGIVLPRALMRKFPRLGVRVRVLPPD